MDDNKFPTWAYGPGGKSGIFNSAEEIPAGWQDHPSKVEDAPDTSASGVKTPIASANGSISEAKVAKSTTAASQTATDPAKAAKSGVAGMTAPATGDTASKTAGDTAGLDAHGHPYDPAVHAGTGSKTKDGLWRMKVGVKRPAPAEGFPKVAPPLDL